MIKYIERIWLARYFWSHLARAELKYKFRRSKLGIFWTFLNPLLLTLLMSIVFGGLFNVPVREYAPYVLSGLVVWELLVSSIISGSNSLLVSEPYIRQFRHPLAIYPLKTTIVNTISFLIALAGLLLWILVERPNNILISIISLPLNLLVLFLMCWPLTIITSFVHAKFRDFTQVMALVMQAVWYVSPVFFEAKMFKSANLAYLIEYNPVTHILNLVRLPFLQGKFPSFFDYSFVAGLSIVFYIIAILKVKKQEKDMIFYL